MCRCANAMTGLVILQFFCVGRVEWDVRIWVWKVIVMGALVEWFLGV